MNKNSFDKSKINYHQIDMESYFGRIKSKKYTPYTYKSRSYREYVDEQALHIRHLEKMVEILIDDVILLDNKLRMNMEHKESTDETKCCKNKDNSSP